MFHASQPLFPRQFWYPIGGCAGTGLTCARRGVAMHHGDLSPDGGPRIGAQLRAARLASRRSIAEVAEQSGLTKGFLSKLERDLTNVSVASLIRLCGALGISVGTLFE